jgi:hypothetical protein
MIIRADLVAPEHVAAADGRARLEDEIRLREAGGPEPTDEDDDDAAATIEIDSDEREPAASSTMKKLERLMTTTSAE